jgi:phosphoribosylformylglycinamidine synthase
MPSTPPPAPRRPRPARALTFDPAEDVAAPFLNLSRPKVAILREQGVNSHVEMAYAFTEAGFEAFDVHMTDLQTGRARWTDFKGVVACGGFSYGDTLGAGIGWARSITFNPALAEQFQAFFGRPDTFGLGVCNGCQMFAELADIIPGAQDWPRFTPTRASASRRACRWSRCWSRPACSSQAWPAAACRSRWRTARALPTSAPGQRRPGDARDALRGPHRAPTEAYPFNPNGSPGGLTGGDHGRRPLHGHDAAPRARVPQHPDELEKNTHA